MSGELIVLQKLVFSQVRDVQMHKIHSKLDCFKCFLMLLFATLDQVLRQLQYGLLGRLEFLRSIKVGFKNIFSSLLTLLFIVNFGQVLHVDQVTNLFVKEHVEYFEGDNPLFLLLVGVWTRVLDFIDHPGLALCLFIKSVENGLVAGFSLLG